MKNKFLSKAGILSSIAVLLLSTYQPNISYSQENSRASQTSQSDTTKAQTIRRRVPNDFGKIVESHVRKMFKEGYALGINNDDLFHGHLIRDANAGKRYSSLEEFLSQVEVVLYHTDENCIRWNSSKDNPYGRKQRSIVGLKDGSIETAIDYASLRDSSFTYDYMRETYNGYGTVFSWEFVNKNKDLDDGGLKKSTIADPQNLARGNNFFPDYYININAEKNGRFKVDGVSFDVYMKLTDKSVFDSVPKEPIFMRSQKTFNDSSSVFERIMRFYPNMK